MKRLMLWSVLGGAVGSALAAVPTGAGPYNWADYLPVTAGGGADARAATLTADQTWVVEAARTAKPFWPGQLGDTDFWQVWTGASVTASSGTGFRVMKGNVVFENEVISRTTENFIGYTGPVQLTLRGGGSLHVTKEPLRVGRSYNNGTAGTATVFVEEGGTLSGADGRTLSIGNTLPGALWVDGGRVVTTNGNLAAGSAAAGYVRQNGGAVSLGGKNGETTLTVGGAAPYASLHLSGGELASRKMVYGGEYGVLVGSGANAAAEVYADGGTLRMVNERFMLGAWGSAAGTATLTVDGTADLRVGLLGMGISDQAGTAVLNLNGGRLAVEKVFADYGKTKPTRQINFDGGTLEGKAPDFPATVYPKGGAIHVAASSTDVSLRPRLATGWGVASIELTAAGAGYVTAPRVTISGGQGRGATGYAVLAKDRTVARVVVTCRGEGYAADDVLTVAFASETGSGAAATATLAANGAGALRKTGAGVWHQIVDSAFAGDVVVEAGALAVDGANLTALKSLALANGAALGAGRSGTEGTVREASVNRVDIRDGVAWLYPYGAAGEGRLTLGALNLENGLALVERTTGLALKLSDAGTRADGAIVPGVVYAGKDASAYRSPSLFTRAADGSLALIETTAAATEGANFCPAASNTEATAPEVTRLACAILPLSPAVQCYVKSAGRVEITSGMIVYRRPQADIQRFAVTGGGALTTRAPGGMRIYGDSYQVVGRSYSGANGGAVHVGGWRRIFGPFADADASTPLALTVAGERQGRPELGAVAWLVSGQDRFTGGLNLINGGVVVSGANALGGGVRAAGYSSIAAYNHVFNIPATCPITIAAKGALIFSPSAANDNVVASALSGAGDLLTSDVNRPDVALAYTGDHAAFTGDYYIQGRARIAPETFSAAAGVRLADGADGVGVLETHGTLDRAPGLGKGELCWKRHACYPAAYGLRGGFAAQDGDLTVNLGGDARKLLRGADYLPEGAVIQLQSASADGALTLANGFELNGGTQRVCVWTGKTATLAGAVSDAAGGGRLDVAGDLAFAGTLEATAANLAAGPLLAVDGALDLTGARVALAADTAALAEYQVEGVTLATATGAVTGAPVFAGNAPRGWKLRVRDGALALVASRGSALVVR